MFAETLLPTLVVAALGQAAAVVYLRTGRFWVGLIATAGLWIAIDWWLLQRYLYEVPVSAQRLPAATVQAIALLTVLALLWAAVRRWRSRRHRQQRFADGMRAFLADDLGAARRSFRQLVWSDPWDAGAWIALGDVLRADRKNGPARRCYRQAAAVDGVGRYADLLRVRRHEAG